MPKKQAQRRIDKSQGGSARVITVSGGSSTGTDVEAHALNSSKHTGTLAESQAPWAITDTEFNAHTASPNAHHNRQHSLLSTTDHTLTAGAYSIVGAVLDNTIGTLSIASSGDGIDVAKSGGQFSIAVDVSDFAGNGLGDDGSNNLYVKVSEGIEIVSDALRVDEDYAFAWANDHTHSSTVGSASFTTGFAGSGWRIDTDDASLELNDLTVRGQLSVYELLVRQIRATNGNVFVSDSAKIDSVSGSGPYTLSVATDDVHGFAVGDLIRAQRFTGTGTYQSNMQVTGVTDTKTFVATLTSGSAPAAGMEFVRLGNTTDSDRRGSIYLAASDSDAPFIDIIDGVDSFGDWNTSAVLKARFGNLAGVTDADFGVLSGYGVYVKGGGYFKGTVAAANADVVIDETTGMNLQARNTAAETADPGTEINWTTNPIDPSSGRGIARIWGTEYSSGGLVTHQLKIEAQTDDADNRNIVLQTEAGISQQSLIGIYSGTSTNRVLIQSTADGGGNGEINLSAENIITNGVTVRPQSDLGTSLGTGTYRFYELHVDTLYTGTISSTDTGHNHNDLYYQKAEVTTLLAGKSDTSHTHAGYAAASHTHDDRYYTESEIDVTLASYYTSAEIDTTLANYSLVGHTHDSRYYTESETDALLATKAASSHTHDSRYYTESEVDSLIAALPASGHTHDDRYYTESEADALLATKASTSHTHDSLTSAGAITLTHDTSSYVNLVDGSGTYARINATGIQSVIPAFSSGVDRSGIDITWAGDINARDITAVNLSTFTFERHQVAAVGTTLAVNTAGKLANEFALTTTGTTHTFDIADPEAGAEQVFQVGDVVRISGMAYANVPTNSETGTPSRALTLPFMPLATVDRNQVLATAYLTIAAADTDYDGYTRYTATYNSGPEYVAFLPGTGAVRWSGGMIVMTSDGDDYAPYIDVFDAGSTPWASGTDTKYVRLGRLDGLGVVASEQYGIALGSDLDDSSAPRFVAGSAGISAYKLDYTANDGTADTVSIAATGRVKFGTDVSADATTYFDFNPSVDNGTYASLVVRANLQSTKVELPQGEIAVYTATDLFDEGYDDYWTARVNRYGVQLTAGAHDAYTTVSAGIHRFADQAFEIRNNASADIGTPSEYPIYRVSANSAGATTGYVPDEETDNYGYYRNLGWNYNDPIVKHLAMFAPDATESGQLLSTAAQMEFGFLNLKTGGEFTMLRLRSDEDGYGGVVIGGENVFLSVSATTQMVGEISLTGDVTITTDPDSDENPTYFMLQNLPTSDAGLPSGAIWNDAGTLKVA